MVHPQAWGQTREQNQNGRKTWERTPRTESLDVPAFLRRQMD